MKTLLKIADKYLEKSDWKTISVLKICLFSLGLFCGASVCERGKKRVRAVAGCVFLATYIPLMLKLCTVVRELFAPADADAETVPEPEAEAKPETEEETEAEAEPESAPEPETEE